MPTGSPVMAEFVNPWMRQDTGKGGVRDNQGQKLNVVTPTNVYYRL